MEGRSHKREREAFVIIFARKSNNQKRKEEAGSKVAPDHFLFTLTLTASSKKWQSKTQKVGCRRDSETLLLPRLCRGGHWGLQIRLSNLQLANLRSIPLIISIIIIIYPYYQFFFIIIIIIISRILLRRLHSLNQCIMTPSNKEQVSAKPMSQL